ncbi:uncharacterized protein LOC120344977 [Styela clava]
MFRDSLRKIKDKEVKSNDNNVENKFVSKQNSSSKEKLPLIKSQHDNEGTENEDNKSITEKFNRPSSDTRNEEMSIDNIKLSKESGLPGFSEDNKKELKKKKKSLHHSITITNPESVDHDELVRKMRERFKKKVRKWEYRINLYANIASLMTFALLTLQVLQMAIQPFRGIWISNKNLIVMQNILVAFTALIAGFQLKMKYNEKADKYRRGVKIYYHLLRMTSYYTIMNESGGKTDYENTIEFWKEALKKEIESVPVMQAFKS